MLGRGHGRGSHCRVDTDTRRRAAGRGPDPWRPTSERGSLRGRRSPWQPAAVGSSPAPSPAGIHAKRVAPPSVCAGPVPPCPRKERGSPTGGWGPRGEGAACRSQAGVVSAVAAGARGAGTGRGRPPLRTSCPGRRRAGGRPAGDAHLGGALGGAVEPGPAQAQVHLLPGLAPQLLHLQEALDLGAAAGVQEVLSTGRAERQALGHGDRGGLGVGTPFSEGPRALPGATLRPSQ